MHYSSLVRTDGIFQNFETISPAHTQLLLKVEFQNTLFRLPVEVLPQSSITASSALRVPFQRVQECHSSREVAPKRAQTLTIQGGAPIGFSLVKCSWSLRFFWCSLTLSDEQWNFETIELPKFFLEDTILEKEPNRSQRHPT